MNAPHPGHFGGTQLLCLWVDPKPVFEVMNILLDLFLPSVHGDRPLQHVPQFPEALDLAFPVEHPGLRPDGTPFFLPFPHAVVRAEEPLSRATVLTRKGVELVRIFGVSVEIERLAADVTVLEIF